MHRLVAVQRQARHVGVGRREGLLEVRGDMQAPVVVEGILMLATEFRHLVDATAHGACHLDRIVDDDGVARARFLAQGVGDELVDLLEVLGAGRRAGEDDRERQLAVFRVQQNAEQIENLFGGAHAAREDDDAMCGTHEGFKALLDVRHDDQFIDDRVGRFGGDDARLRDAQIATFGATLLGVRDVGALHRALHGTRATSGADVEITQAEVVTHVLGVLVLLAVDGVTAPAGDQTRLTRGLQRPGVAQDMEHRIGGAFGGREIETRGVLDLVGHIDDVTQHAGEMLANAADHLAVDEGIAGRIVELEANAAVLLQHLDLEILVCVEHRDAVIGLAAAVEHGQRTAAQDVMQPVGGGIAQAIDLILGEHFQAAFRRDDGRDQHGAGIT